MTEEFWWREFDVQHLLPLGWQAQILEIANSRAKSHTIIPTSVTSREGRSDVQLPILTVDGGAIRQSLPWLFDLYLNEFRNIGQTCSAEPVVAAAGLRHSINLNVQKAGMRYEAHIDSNPLEGLLYITSHPPGSGGELVVCRRQNVSGIEEISGDCVKIYPREGQLVFFDARFHAHFVTPLNDPLSIRVVAAMNYYTPSCPESARPADLDKHLGLSN